MSQQYQALVDQAQQLAAEMPLAMAESLADAIGRWNASSWLLARAGLLQGISHPHYRSLAGEFLDIWRESASGLGPQAVQSEEGIERQKLAHPNW